MLRSASKKESILIKTYFEVYILVFSEVIKSFFRFTGFTRRDIGNNTMLYKGQWFTTECHSREQLPKRDNY
jgi:hypothetical protein